MEDDLVPTTSTFDNFGVVDISDAGEEGLDMVAGTFNNETGASFIAYDCDGDNIEMNGPNSPSLFDNDGDIRVARTDGTDPSGRDDMEMNSGGTFTNGSNATFGPGASPGELEVRGDFDFGSSTITFEIDGTSNTVEYDRIQPVNSATLDISGATAELVFGYAAAAGHCYTIVDGSATVTGPFAVISAVGLDPTLELGTADYTDPTEVEICVQAVTVPVELSSFEGNYTDDGLVLEWQTVSEINNEGFLVQRRDDSKAWESIGFVEGKGTVTELGDYELVDYEPLSGINYYRLKQIDYDGAYEYSDVVSVMVDSPSKEVFGVFPNPFGEQLLLELDQDIDALSVQLHDVAGRLIYNHNGWLDHINTADLDAGTYILTVTGTDYLETVKVTKQ